MKILFFCVLSCLTVGSLHSMAKNDPVKLIYKSFLHADSAKSQAYAAKLNHYGALAAKIERILQDVADATLLPGVWDLLLDEDERRAKLSDFDPQTIIALWDASEECPEILPFLKTACKNFKTTYGGYPILLNKEFPADTYPDNFTDPMLQHRFGPLLNPETMTYEEYNSSHKTYVAKKVTFLEQNLSELLFPGGGKYMGKTKAEIKALSKPDEKRDLAIIKRFWKAAMNDADLLPLIEKAYTNFEKTYDKKAPLHSLVLDKKGLTLAKYRDNHKKSPIARLCTKLEKVNANSEEINEESSFLKNGVIVAALSGIAYLVYKNYSTQKQVAHTSKTKVA
jgi:hypothetical protein